MSTLEKDPTNNENQVDNESQVDDMSNIRVIINVNEKYTANLQPFSVEQAARLPDYKLWDYEILLILESKPPFGPVYKTTWEEEVTLYKYIKNNLPM